MNISAILILLVATIQAAIAFVEIFFWKSPQVHSRLGFTIEQALTAAPIVANAGLDNAFLAAGLIWALFLGEPGRQIALFLLICVAIAGIFGAVTLKKRTVVCFKQYRPPWPCWRSWRSVPRWAKQCSDRSRV